MDTDQCGNCDQSYNNLGNHLRENDECLKTYEIVWQIAEPDIFYKINRIGLLMKKCTYKYCPTSANNYINLKNHIQENEACKLDLLRRNSSNNIDTLFDVLKIVNIIGCKSIRLYQIRFMTSTI